MRGPSAAAGAERQEGRSACGVAGEVGEGSCQRYVHRALYGRDRVVLRCVEMRLRESGYITRTQTRSLVTVEAGVLRCVWDGGRGLCGYDMEGGGRTGAKTGSEGVGRGACMGVR